MPPCITFILHKNATFFFFGRMGYNTGVGGYIDVRLTLDHLDYSVYDGPHRATELSFWNESTKSPDE
jgi:hypothetical protein